MTYTLHPHQETIIAKARGVLARHNSVLIQSPTGSGKTVLSSFMHKGATDRGYISWFIVHRQELLDQVASAFSATGINYGFIAAGYPGNMTAPVQICSIDTLRTRIKNISTQNMPYMATFDECHHFGAAGWRNVRAAMPQGTKIVGLSATPNRLDGKGLGDIFESIVHGPSVAWLVENGYLSKFKIFGPASPDLSGVHTKMGEFDKIESARVMDQASITGDAVAHYKRLCPGKRALVYAINIEHSKHIAEQFRAAGFTAVHLDGKTPRDERRASVRAFERGDIQVMVNVGLFEEGFDVPGVEVILDLNPTKSLSRWLQRCGRALRVAPGKEQALILDHAGNAMRHGLPDFAHEWTLDGNILTRKKKVDEITGPDLRRCMKCYFISKAHRTVCEHCGEPFELKLRQVEHVDGDLVEITTADIAIKAKRREQGRAGTLQELISLGKQRGYKNPAAWAGHIFRARGGR